MAGPGGGPPRKSHTKSRKGCRMCKKRHIRCDEQFPQCRNCTKHSVRCDYMDVSQAGEEPAKGSNPPDLLTSPQLQQVLDKWRLTGDSPLAELRKDDTTYWTRFSTIDLRLIHHVTTMSSDLYRRGYSLCTPWTVKMSSLITVALSSDFAMNALLALSATHLAWQTKNSDTEHLAHHHRVIALTGLQGALSTFSEHTAEAVLSASMLLSWQAKEWRTWVSLQQGISTVMRTMRPWLHQSDLAKFLESQRSLARIRASSTPSISGLPSQTPAAEDLQNLEHIVDAIHNLRLRLSSFPDLVQHIDEVLEYVGQMQQDYPLHFPEAAFERLLQLRSTIFWLPTAILRPDESDLGALAMMCHFYALGLVLEPLFPEVQGAHLGTMSLDPLEKVCQVIQARSAARPHDTTLQTALSMLDVPVQIVHMYRTSRSAVASPAAPYQSSPQPAVYTPQTYTLPSPADVSRLSSYANANVQSPFNAYQGGYNLNTFQSTLPYRHDSAAGRTQSSSRLSIGSSLQSMSSQHSSTENANIDYFSGAPTYQPNPGYAQMHDYQSRLVHTSIPAQIWT